MTAPSVPDTRPPRLDEMLRPQEIRLAPIARVLGRVLDYTPWQVAQELMAGLGVVQSVCRPCRLRRVVRWARAQSGRRMSWPRLTLQIFANHGRFVAREALLGLWSPRALVRQVTLLGTEHLPQGPSSGGVLLLGFHLGPPSAWLALRAAGYPVRFMGPVEASGRRPRPAWRGALDPAACIGATAGLDPETRWQGLYQARRLLLDGAMLFITADGPLGREVTRVALPGNPLVLRSGWLALRRWTRALTVPVLTWREGWRQRIALHAPLPPPVADFREDVAACREALTPTLREYVRRFPEQCRYLAFDL